MYQFKTQPYDKQLEALRMGWSREGFAYLMEMGTGKTKVDIDDTGAAALEDIVQGWLIIAPKGVYRNWRGEISKHMTDDIHPYVYVWKGQKTASERSEWESFMARIDVFPVMVVNIEALSMKTSRALSACEEFIEHVGNCKLTVDESTRIKNESARRTKNVVKLARMCNRRRILTGSPTTHSPLDLYSQFEVVQPRCLGQRSFWTFRERYAVLREIPHPSIPNRKVKIPVAFRNLDELQKLVGRHSYRCRLSDIHEVESVYEYIDCEMTDEQRRAYEDMRLHMIHEIEEGRFVSSTQIMTQILRMHQICCGYTVDEDGQVHYFPNHRTSSIMEAIEGIDGKVIIWSAYRKGVASVVEALSENYGENNVLQYHGGVSADDRETAIREFQDGSPRFFVGTAHTGGMGITLTAANTTIYHSNTENLEHRIQSEARPRRIGQTGACLYLDVRIPGTVDDKVIRNLINKVNISDAITNDDPREWLKPVGS